MQNMNHVVVSRDAADKWGARLALVFCLAVVVLGGLGTVAILTTVHPLVAGIVVLLLAYIAFIAVLALLALMVRATALGVHVIAFLAKRVRR